MINIFDIISYTAILSICGLIAKMWSSLDKYFEKKAENLATRQDIVKITEKTETVQAEFHKILGKFDADLKFKYQFYESQYKELYSELYQNICKSEALRYTLVNLSKEHMDFNNIPIVEYVPENNKTENQTNNNSIIEEIISLVKKNHSYASPELIKLVYTFKNVEDYEKSPNTKDNEFPDIKDKIVQIKCTLKANIIKTILKDYYWLRQQLNLQESIDETDKLQNGKFILIHENATTGNT